MATYSLLSPSISNANDKNMLAISNSTGSGKVIKVYRVFVWSPTTSSVTGGLAGLLLGVTRDSVYSGGTALPFMPHNSCVTAGSNNPFTGINAASGATTITGSIGIELSRAIRFTDEFAAGDFNFDVIPNIHPFQIILDTGYADSNVEPVTIRENQYLLIRTDSAPSNAAGNFRFHIELDIS